jgi:outer membrane protein insertion porin family
LRKMCDISTADGRCGGARRLRRAAWVRAAAQLVLALAAPLLLAHAATAAVITSAEVTGHESLRERDVLAALSLEEGSELVPARVPAGVDSLLRLLVGFGRPFASVTATWDTTDSGASVVVRVDEGPEVSVGEVEFEAAEGPVSERLLRGERMRPGAAVTREAMREDTDALLTGFENDGRPFASVQLPRFVMLDPDGRLYATVDVSEGIPVWFGDIVVAGNTVTRDYVIARESGLVRGEPYSARRLAAARSRLEKLPYLGSVDEPVVAVDPSTGEATVGISVAEAPANRVSGVFGVSGGAGNEKEVTGLIDVGLGNIAGTGRIASASWEQIREGETEISFAYTEPWVLGAPIDIGFRGNQSVRDTLYTTTEGDLLVTARMGDRTRLTWSVGAERYVPGSIDESTTTSVRTSFSAEFDGADAFWNPTRGRRLNGSAEYSAKEVADSGRRERSGTFTAQLWQFLPLASRHVLALRLRGELLASTEEEVPVHELLVLGGARSLRGYREEQFRGNRTALASLEYRLLLGRRSRVIAFVDAGYWFREGPNSARGTELGYGIGLRGDTRLGTISLDYGLGEGDHLLDGKLHAGLIREF